MKQYHALKRDYEDVNAKYTDLVEKSELTGENNPFERLRVAQIEIHQLKDKVKEMELIKEEHSKSQEVINALREEVKQGEKELELCDKGWHSRFTSTLGVLKEKYQSKFDAALQQLLEQQGNKVLGQLVGEQKTRLVQFNRDLVNTMRELEGVKKERTLLEGAVRQCKIERDVLAEQLGNVGRVLTLTNKHNKELFFSCRSMKAKLESFLRVSVLFVTRHCCDLSPPQNGPPETSHGRIS